VSKTTVDEYIAGLDPWQAEIVAEVRRVMLEAAPAVEESVRWDQPVYEANGPFAYIKAYMKAVHFGFWRGIEILDPKGLLQGSGEKMRHVKLASLDDVDLEAFPDYIQQAIKLNLKKGDPTKNP
jgi:hypothetical protein